MATKNRGGGGGWKGGCFDFFVLLCSIKMPFSCLFLIAFLYSFNKKNWLHGFETEAYDSFVE